jgi:hypothetical protein
MEADEASKWSKTPKVGQKPQRLTSSIVAMVLAIASMGGSNSVKDTA